MTAQGFIVLAIILLMIAALAKEVMRPGLILFSALIFLMIFGTVNDSEVLAGFSNKGMITVGILFVVSEGIKQSGALNKLAMDGADHLGPHDCRSYCNRLSPQIRKRKCRHVFFLGGRGHADDLA